MVAYDHMLGMLVASKPSTNQLFPGYGLVKVGYTKHALQICNALLLYESMAFNEEQYYRNDCTNVG